MRAQGRILVKTAVNLITFQVRAGMAFNITDYLNDLPRTENALSRWWSCQASDVSSHWLQLRVKKLLACTAKQPPWMESSDPRQKAQCWKWVSCNTTIGRQWQSNTFLCDKINKDSPFVSYVHVQYTTVLVDVSCHIVEGSRPKIILSKLPSYLPFSRLALHSLHKHVTFR